MEMSQPLLNGKASQQPLCIETSRPQLNVEENQQLNGKISLGCTSHIFIAIHTICHEMYPKFHSPMLLHIQFNFVLENELA